MIDDLLARPAFVLGKVGQSFSKELPDSLLGYRHDDLRVSTQPSHTVVPIQDAVLRGEGAVRLAITLLEDGKLV